MPAVSATYPGITGKLLSLSGTESVGLQPGRFTLDLDAAATPSPTGTLTFTDETRTVTVPGCRVVDAQWSGVGSFRITLEDRRWRWRHGVVFGHYNEPIEGYDGVAYEKTPQELAELLWAEMNETSLDVTLLPNDARPEVFWYASNPAEELIALLELLGCVLAPQLDGGWKVYPIGSGSVLSYPSNLKLSTDVSQDFAIYPDAVSVVTGPIQYEVCFALEAVGDTGYGSAELLDDLVYKPAWGWEKEDSDFYGVTGTYERDGKTLNYRDLARSSVRRWYRIASMPSGSGSFLLNPPGYPETLPDVEGLWAMLPLIPLINETNLDFLDPDNGKRYPAEVWGEYEKDEQTGFITRPGTKVADSFSIDVERGIVKFSRPMHRVVGGEYLPANLFLRCVVEVNQPELNIGAGYQRTIETGLNNGTGTEPVEVDDIDLQWRPQWNADGTLDALGSGEEYPNNREEVDAKTDYYLSAKLASYQTETGGTIRLGGIHAPNLNGLQTSVAWSFSARSAPTTTVGVASRANPYLPDYRKAQKETLNKSQRLKKERRERLKARRQFRGQP